MNFNWSIAWALKKNKKNLLRDGFFFFFFSLFNFLVLSHILCVTLPVSVYSVCGWGRAKYSSCTGIVSCMVHWIYSARVLSVFFLATITRAALKYCQGSGRCLQLILSEGNAVCYPGLDFVQVLCIPEV